MKKIIVFFAVMLLSLNIYTQVKTVTVYSDRALVTRVIQIDAKSGLNEAVFKSLPPNVDLESVRAKGTSLKGGGLKILDIKVDKNYEKVFTDKDAKIITDQIEIKKNTISILNANIDRIKKQKDLMNIFSEKSKTTNAEDLDKGKFATKQWQEAYDFYQSQTEKLDNDYFRIMNEIKKENENIRALEDQNNQYKNKVNNYSINAAVSYQLKSDSTVEISLSYIVTGTYWYPVYDCRVNMESKELSLEYYAKVKQNTGEDWNDINLILSTARPDLSGQMPVVSPWELDLYTYENDYKDTSKSYSMDKKESAKMDKGEDEVYIKEKEKQEDYKAKIDSQGLSINYTILQKVAVISGKEEVKVTIASSIKLNTEYSWSIMPRFNESSFLKGKIKNNSEFTFLPGVINIFVNDSYIAKSGIGLINPDQEFVLSLGRDPRITATFLFDDLNKGTKLMRKFEQRRYIITIVNNSPEDVSISINDIIPKTLQPKKINIKVIKLDPEPKNIESESICSWEQVIKKGEKFVITEEWYVDYPQDLTITGL